jgi:La-related protein 7
MNKTDPRKYRHRKKHLYNAIREQMEFYFSDSNLSKDRFMSEALKLDECKKSVFLECCACYNFP